MRILGIAIVGLTLAIVAAAWLQHSSQRGPATAGSTSIGILVEGKDNTLASLARRVNDPLQFEYDAATRTAICRSNLFIEGELQLGREGDPDSAETLEMDTRYCGDLRVEVRSGGSLRLYHSQMRTVSQVLSNAACTQGYALFVDGELVMIDSRLAYMSGSTSQCLRSEARATIRDSVFDYGDGSALSCFEVDGSRIVIEGSDILGSGNWGLFVRGSGGDPLVLRDSVFSSQVGDVYLAGRDPAVRLVDCTFDRDKIKFRATSGQVEVVWTRSFKVIDRGTRSAIEGMTVRARRGDETVEARTDANGGVTLALPDYTGRPGRGGRMAIERPASHWQVEVVGPDGTVVGRIDDLVVRAKEPDEAEIEVNE